MQKNTQYCHIIEKVYIDIYKINITEEAEFDILYAMKYFVKPSLLCKS